MKGAGLQRVQLPPGNWFAPSGSNRDGGRGDEAVGAFDGKGRLATPRACRPFTIRRGLQVFRPICVPSAQERNRQVIRTLKYSDVEVQFGREVAELKIATAASIQSPNIEATQKPIWEDLSRLASVRPRTAILQAWQQVEVTLIRVAKDRHLEAAPAVWQMPMVLGAVMLNKENISTPQYELLSRLRQLVSEATHAPVDSINPDDAVQFVGLALRMAASLDSES